MMTLIRDYIADLQSEFKGYGRKTLRKDLLAGLTTGAVALPVALAFGISSGSDASAGLIAAIIAAFVVGTLSGASFQISGPTGAMAAILIPLATKYGLEAVFASAALAGILLIVAGLSKTGKIINLIPTAVITGFTSGIAMLVVLGQADNLLGVHSEGENALQRVIFLFQNSPPVNPYALIYSVAVAVFIFLFPRKWNAIVPGSLLAIIIATMVQSIIKLPVATVGTIPQTLIHETRLDISFFTSLSNWQMILLPGTSIAVLCLIESLLCGVIGGRMKGETLNADRELVAQGIGNVILPFFGGVPVTAAIARTSVAIKSGCRTRATGLIQGAFLLASMFVLSPFMSQIPFSALAGLLMVIAWRMNDWSSIRYIFQRRFHGAIVQFFITLAATVIFDLTIAIAAGCIVATILFVVKMLDLDVTVSEYDPSRMDGDFDLPLRTEVVYITGSLFFGSVGKLEAKLKESGAQLLILSMRGVPSVDVSAVQALLTFCKARKKSDMHVAFSCLAPDVRKMLDRSGVTELLGEGAYFPTTKEAIVWYSGQTLTTEQKNESV